MKYWIPEAGTTIYSICFADSKKKKIINNAD
jgi:hypothetical protein